MAYGGGYGAPYGTALQRERAQHVDALLRAYPARPVNPDRSVLDLPLELRDGKATALRVSLPPHFPQERPSLSVLLPVVHPAVDATGRLHTPGVANWAYGASALADVVAEAVAALTASAVVDARQPPGGGAAGAGGVPYPPGYPSALVSGGGAGGSTAAAAAGGSGPLPGSPHARIAAAAGVAAAVAAAGGQLPDLARMPTAQLAKLVADGGGSGSSGGGGSSSGGDDGAEFRAALRGVLAGSKMAAALEDARQQNRQLAASNLAQQGAIAEARNQLAVVRGSEYSAIKARLDALLKRQAAVAAVLGGAKFRERLEDAVSEADAASGALSAAFLDGTLPPDSFVDQYLGARARYHALDLKRQAVALEEGGEGAAGGGAS